MYKHITKPWEYEFDVSKEGIYAVHILASCRSGKILGFWGGEDLKVELDGAKFGDFDSPTAWNGSKLKGASKTVIFVIKLLPGKHKIKFIPRAGAQIVEELKIEKFDAKISILQDIQSEERNRQPWITISVVGLPLKFLDISVLCEKRKRDSDDAKIVIDGKIQKNSFSGWWSRNWLWQGRKLNGIIQENRFNLDSQKENHIIDLWADRTPVIKELRLGLEKDNSNDYWLNKWKTLKPYTHKGVWGSEDYNRYDQVIIERVAGWNREFFSQKYPPDEPLDPNLVKAMIYQESRIGYNEKNSGNVNVMQVGNDGDPSLLVLNGGGKSPEYELDENGKLWKVDYGGRAQVNNIEDSILWGSRWLYHKAQGIGSDGGRYWIFWKDAVKLYEPAKDEYVENVWSIYENGVDNRGGTSIRLWTVLIFLVLSFSGSGWWLHANQGKIYFKYFDAGESHIFTGRARLEVGVLDGLKIKKTVIYPIEDRSLGTSGLEKETIRAEFYDLDGDEKDELMVSGLFSYGWRAKYFYKIGKNELEKIPVVNGKIFHRERISGREIFFGGRDDSGKLTFVGADLVRYDNAPDVFFKSYYRLNDKNEMEVFKEEKKEVDDNFYRYFF